MFPSVGAAFRSPTFIGQLLITMAINFGINFGYAWASFSAWGQKPSPASWPRISPWVLDPGGVNSCLALDMLLSAFLIGFMCMLLGTGGTMKEVREHKCDMLAPELLSRGLWRYTPVPIENLCARSFATGLFILTIIGIPSFLIVWIAVASTGGTMPGLSFTIFKGIWCTAVSGVVYALVFPAAISKSNHPELEFEELLSLAASSPKYAHEQDLPYAAEARVTAI